MLVCTVRTVQFSKQRARFSRDIYGHDFLFFFLGMDFEVRTASVYGTTCTVHTVCPYNDTEIEAENREEKNLSLIFFLFGTENEAKIFSSGLR